MPKRRRDTSAFVPGLIAALLTAAAVIATQDPAEMMPTPTEQHQWLKKFVGEWEVTAEMDMGPGSEPMITTASETVRALGDFWIIANMTATIMDTPMETVLTLGYDPEKGKYIGTWIDSNTATMWTYEGTLNEAGTKLSLETRGSMMPGAEPTNFIESTVFISDDERVFTSKMQMPDGSWQTLVTGTYKRKK